MAIERNIEGVMPIIDKSLNDEFHFVAGCSPIWILNWLTSDKYILKPKQRVVVSPNTKEDLIEWARSDAFSSNCASLEHYASGEASEEEMLKYTKETIRNIEYQTDPERLKETLRCAQWALRDIKLIVKELC